MNLVFARVMRLAVSIVIVGVGIAAPARAADEKKLGWSNKAELAYVLTAGNAESATFGFKAASNYNWKEATLAVSLGGVRAEATNFARAAFGTADDFRIVEQKTTSLTAENYYFNLRYERTISSRTFWYAGAGWDRNRPAGINNRYTGGGGIGNTWFDGDTARFKTYYGVTLTRQDNVVDTPGFDDTFSGLRGGWDYMRKFGSNTTYANLLVVDANLEESQDWRGDMINSVSVSMNSHLSLKVSLQWLYDNLPSNREVALFNLPNDGVADGTVRQELKKLDSIFTTSIVINW